MERVIAYIDGYNLYFGLKEAGLSRYKWLNIKALVIGRKKLANSQFPNKINGNDGNIIEKPKEWG